MQSTRLYVRTTLALSCFMLGLAPAASAEPGSCEYRMFSKQMGRSFLVCQTAESAEQCGTWPRPSDQPLTAGFAVGKAERKIDFSTKGCDASRVVASCQLASGSEIHFYEGNVEQLASGCRHMYGRFVAANAEKTVEAEAERVLRLIGRSPQ